ncbi:MAG: hypothetical protein H6633_33735 [Anaerolineales bacterium]|nr:hypothetical protein [Anaerolineales bacterium]
MPVLDFFPQIDQSSLMILGAAFLVEGKLSIFAIGAAFWFTWLRNWPV